MTESRQRKINRLWAGSIAETSHFTFIILWDSLSCSDATTRADNKIPKVNVISNKYIICLFVSNRS